MPMVVPLSRMCEGEKGKISRLELPVEVRERLCGLGFVNGEEVELVKIAPFGDPKVFRIKGTNVTLRNDIAMWILVETSSIPLSSAQPGEYLVSLINGGWGLRERMRQYSIQEGATVKVVENSIRRIEVEVHGKTLFLSRGQAFRVIVRER